MKIAAFDIGGTNIKWGIVTDGGEIVDKGSFPSRVQDGADQLIENVQHKSRQLKEEYSVSGIAISTAGQVNSDKGEIVHATGNIPGYTGMKVAARIESAVGLPVRVENDVNCTALGEAWRGNARGVKNFFCVTLGTGIGGALVMENNLVPGASWCAGEMGHMPLYPGGLTCTCGNRGCLEQYASASALERQVEIQKGRFVSLPEFFEEVRNGVAESVRIFETWVDHLACGLQSIVHLLNPSVLIIGGGISAQGSLLTDAITESLSGKVMPNHFSALHVRIAGKGNEANLLGAVSHYLDNQ
ncbi:N-acetylmannosamine kinase [Salimicrobium jeotgali]|uniref:N-acetylmannosamine kinase n=1 Tax=Salimicrobium jeotgali TaxID=1230341 RepID=K2GAD2_9BACI|nr:ROK family protein [Salimicrobium jeotgali]AKG03809.1 N-acetylmannosamine kinase [Salimicrobium jeotgali]EKE31302.1 putative N-acetylmannosamine kinase [Salimicrobium jeotgali]MBM7697114.1 putative NBD/HSP70 family sugar kinase [Salimicrobium jeotgali]